MTGTATREDLAKKKESPPDSAEPMAARELVPQAKEQGLSLTGPDGLSKQLTKTALETASNEELTERPGHHERAASEMGNVRHGTRTKTVSTEATGNVDIEVPRERAGTFEPQIVRTRQRHLSGVDETVLSLDAIGLTTGEISAHFAEIHGASLSNRPLAGSPPGARDDERLDRAPVTSRSARAG